MSGIEPLWGIAEPVASLSHLAGALLALLLARSLLRSAAGERAQEISLGVFAGCVLLLMVSSGLYHLFPLESTSRAIFRRLDHIGIWLSTAACSTPIWYFFLRRSRAGYWLLAGLWLTALSGAALKTVYLEVLPSWIGVLLFVAFGSVGIPVAIWLVTTRGLRYTLSFFLCGVSLTSGALLELIEEPTLLPGVVGYHELVHLFVMGGLFLHWSFLQGVSTELSTARAGSTRATAPAMAPAATPAPNTAVPSAAQS